MKKNFLVFISILILLLTGVLLTQEEEESEDVFFDEVQLVEAMTTPYGKYPELIIYTLGKMTGENRSNMPASDTYENNAYTRYFKEMLNVQNENVFEESHNYEEILYMSVIDGKLPDIMVVMDPMLLNTLVEEDLIADLTEVYETCTTPRIKEIYESYDTKLLESVTFDGKLMALPETNIYNGPDLLWLRKDWMDELGLEDPKTLKDAEYIIEQFVIQNPAQNEVYEKIGLLCDTDLVGDTNSCYSLDIIFASFDAYPQKWILNEEGEAVYGSITKETKEALKYLRDLYEKGVIDNKFLMRSEKNLSSLVIEGKCGAFFGPWWAPNNPLMEAYKKDPTAQWQPYIIPTDTDGTITTYKPYTNNKCVVVRKGFEHPELVMKASSVLFDYSRYEDENAEEINAYYPLNVDTTARPFVINIDYSDALFRMTKKIQNVLDKKEGETSLLGFERAYYEICKAYLETNQPSPTEWAAYTSRITATQKLLNSKIVYKDWLFEASSKVPKELKVLEKDAFLQMITGEKPMDYFEEFVEIWMDEGGEALTKEINYERNNKN